MAKPVDVIVGRTPGCVERDAAGALSSLRDRPLPDDRRLRLLDELPVIFYVLNNIKTSNSA